MSYSVVNFYKFISLDDLATLKACHYNAAFRHNLIGTILLSEEGINGALAGSEWGVRKYLEFLAEDPRFANIKFKSTTGVRKPFRGLYVKVKPWIVRFADHEDPSVAEVLRGGRIPPKELAKIVATKPKDVVVVDTRNKYETDYGAFAGAETLSIDRFVDFPKVFLKKFRNDKDKTFIMYCTGGIRCEKAVAWAQKEGFPQVYQLDGGILNYFAEVGAEGFEGNCFVFDQRWILDPQLNETDETGSQNLRMQPKPVVARR